MAAWHYVIKQERLGPVSDEDIGELVRNGKILRDTLVWKSGFEGWRPAGDVLASFFVETPPPIPTPPSVPPSARMSEEAAPPPQDDAPLKSIRMSSWSHPEATGPWPRFWARAIDCWLLAPTLSFVIAIAAAFYAPTLYVQFTSLNSTVLGLGLLPVVGIVLALMMAVIGTTPGKAILGIRVTSIADGNKFLFYLIRELKVWVFGLGLGIPFVALFTQIYQCRRVGAGNAAGYDEGFAMVVGRPSGVRVGVGAACAAALFFGMVVLSAIDKTAQAEIETTRTWRNPITQQNAEIARTWTDEEMKTNTGRLFYFASNTLSAEALFGHEVIDGGLDVETYGEALGKVLAPDLTLTSGWIPTTVNGKRGLRATARPLKFPQTHVEVLVRVSGNDAWRVLVFAVGRPTNDLPGRDNLVNALFSTAEY
ncbi:RDD family protein [Ensifer sp. ENS09]|uniref:RDD family protein n=1 Tax=Ensifer sp. ENS09 TaxID=2769263 RepID=UPI001784F876|nr:RDD family protein [Ensifer sp. ENS09]MBD9652906.1 RDD family protein [Ensifer sp. ENS09]